MSSLKPSWYSNVNPNVFISTVVIIGIFIAIVFLAPNAFDLITKTFERKGLIVSVPTFRLVYENNVKHYIYKWIKWCK